MLPMQPCTVKEVANRVNTPEETGKDGEGPTVAASGQAGTTDKATTQSKWAQRQDYHASTFDDTLMTTV